MINYSNEFVMSTDLSVNRSRLNRGSQTISECTFYFVLDTQTGDETNYDLSVVVCPLNLS
jgi:hypothetical protein